MKNKGNKCLKNQNINNYCIKSGLYRKIWSQRRKSAMFCVLDAKISVSVSCLVRHCLLDEISCLRYLCNLQNLARTFRSKIVRKRAGQGVLILFLFGRCVYNLNFHICVASQKFQFFVLFKWDAGLFWIFYVEFVSKLW